MYQWNLPTCCICVCVCSLPDRTKDVAFKLEQRTAEEVAAEEAARRKLGEVASERDVAVEERDAQRALVADTEDRLAALSRSSEAEAAEMGLAREGLASKLESCEREVAALEGRADREAAARRLAESRAERLGVKVGEMQKALLQHTVVSGGGGGGKGGAGVTSDNDERLLTLEGNLKALDRTVVGLRRQNKRLMADKDSQATQLLSKREELQRELDASSQLRRLLSAAKTEEQKAERERQEGGRAMSRALEDAERQRGEVGEWRAKQDVLERAVAEMREEARSSQREVERVEAERRGIEERLEIRATQMDTGKLEVEAELADARKRLQDAAAATAAATAAVEAEQGRAAGLEQTILNGETRYEELERHVGRVAGEKETAETALGECEALQKAAQDDVVELRGRLEKVDGEVGALREGITAMEREKMAAEEGHGQLVEDLAGQKEAAETQLKTAHNATRTEKERYSQLSRQFKRLQVRRGA